MVNHTSLEYLLDAPAKVLEETTHISHTVSGDTFHFTVVGYTQLKSEDTLHLFLAHDLVMTIQRGIQPIIHKHDPDNLDMYLGRAFTGEHHAAFKSKFVSLSEQEGSFQTTTVGRPSSRSATMTFTDMKGIGLFGYPLRLCVRFNDGDSPTSGTVWGNSPDYDQVPSQLMFESISDISRVRIWGRFRPTAMAVELASGESTPSEIPDTEADFDTGYQAMINSFTLTFFHTADSGATNSMIRAITVEYEPAPDVDGGWSSWVDQNECPLPVGETCGIGVITQTRTCNNPQPSGHGANCEGTSQQEVECGEPCAPVDGRWSSWVDDANGCSVPNGETCGTGVLTQTRTCNNPPPSGGGANCEGTDQQQVECTLTCEVATEWWTSWSQWTPWPCPSQGYTQTRTRTCARVGGLPCGAVPHGADVIETHNCFP
eukprot:TRINITY_DN68199_c5_g9_i1.p1 TRINITY_DN68199_c5_g9~~TRINITY_DN68199_c5_g9_i1.p1  ORF type:complete len:429 (+),score=40.55 TRINITY_DN68199_c5_g9_i1:456-1742(+)